MILSGRDIDWYIQTGKLEISPVSPEQFQQNGIDLILDEVEQKQEYILHPDYFSAFKFCLGCTRETLKLPDDLMAFVELRSTWARNGLIIPPTIVDAGFPGNLTLEILPCQDLKVPYGERFAHLIFSRLTSPSEPYRGKYSGQKGITRSIL